MTAVPVEPSIELRFNPTGLRPADIPSAGAFIGSPADALEAALSVVRARVVAQMKAEIRGIAEPRYGQLLRIADLAWQAVFWKYRKMSAPVMADAYVRAYRAANAGDVPMSVIYDLAEKHADKIGEYFHASSRDALGEGFNTLVNRQLPAKAAADRVLDAYGLTNRQMRGVTSAKFDQPVSDVLIREPKAQAREYIDRSFTQRIRKLSTQEEHNVEQQAQQLAWMWLQDKGRLNERAQKIWITAKDEKVCPVCGPLNGKKVGINEKFVTKEGEFWTPGLHPNCRCYLRLIENKYQLEKRFDPHQPRGHDGRWSGGQSRQRQLGTKVNRLESPSARVLQGTIIHRSAQAVGYLTEPRYLTTPLKHRDKEMARLAHGASAWSRSSAHVQRARHMADPDNEYYAGKLKLSRTEKHLKLLGQAVASAPSNSPELYRGLTATPEHLKELKPGSSFDLPMSSFTEDRNFSESFARRWGPMIARSHAKREGREAPADTHPVVMVLEPKAQALNISPLVSERQAEWITRGSFTITRVADDNGLTVVHLKQGSSVSKADEHDVWDPTEHPRDRIGRFATVAERPRGPVIRQATIWEQLEETPVPEVEPVQEVVEEIGQEIGGSRGIGGSYRRRRTTATIGGGQAAIGADYRQIGAATQAIGAVAEEIGATTAQIGTSAGTIGQAAYPSEVGARAAQPIGATRPTPEPRPAPKPAPVSPFVQLHPDQKPYYVVVSDEGGGELDFVFANERFTDSLEEAKLRVAAQRQEKIDDEWRVRTSNGTRGVRVRGIGQDGTHLVAWIAPDDFKWAMQDVAESAAPGYRFDEIRANQNYLSGIRWRNASTHQPVEDPAVISNAEIVYQQGLRPDDFKYRILETTHGHKDMTQLETPHSYRMSGQFVDAGGPPGTVPDAMGKEVQVTLIKPYG